MQPAQDCMGDDVPEALAELKPEIPENFHNRRRANWRPLLAIAERTASKKAAHNAAIEIEKQQVAADPSAGLALLGDNQCIFKETRKSSPRDGIAFSLL